ncbi:hypothetical protein SERLADRAFT_373814 [Serpula lacrymans var. lacrymans S7.9]|uniref:Uncharacterized protein n=1 Tax=Serpula lacrymans var. lacrymans (strain S7.9) TaxID=578457 RepID=F8P9U0_SERL9|nr:uncharacterized protein SERLADRAFT_373814 [Serpula lacrymans var. lacrymans S7.9]EGO20419.1 hypothetical protein SERLADRAFT_373814 [Serpula lacrymans var. lacrymans S7.9]
MFGHINAPMPSTQVVLDVFYFMMRYLAAIVNGMENTHRSAVASNISEAIFKTPSTEGKSAEYRSKYEQEAYLQNMFEKWSRKGGVWSAAATKVHADQLAHVKKGCLSRTRQDLRSDGSHIEGSHKGWNSLMRSFPSGIEIFTALCHDFGFI